MDEIQTPHVILGAGAMGSAAAYQLARRGEPLVLVERFAIGHDRGSSHGAARITRHSYADVRYARLMPAAFRAWTALEADAGRPLFVRTGCLSASAPGTDYASEVARSLEAVGVPHARMTPGQVRRALPPFDLPDGGEAVFEPDAGLLAASTAIAAQVELARRHGGARTRVLERCPIERIDLEGDRPTLVGHGLRIIADRLIVAAGGWVGTLLPRFAGTLRPTRQQVLYFAPDDRAPFAVGRFPAFIWRGAGPHDYYYAMPDFLGLGVKAARHGGPDCNPDTCARVVDPSYRDEVRATFSALIPALAAAPIAREEICLYTEAPGDGFVVGPLPDRPDVIVASPCSGHGFKFSALIGSILADLALAGETEHEVGFWRPPAA